MNKDDQQLREAAKKQAQEAAKRLFGTRTDEQNKALKDVKTIGSPENTIRPDDDDYEPEADEK